MTKHSREDLDRLERSLAQTYSAIPAPHLGTEWAERVMREIRRDAAGIAGKSAAWVELYVWRTAALATAFALVFAGSLFLSNGVELEKGELSALLSEELEAASPLLE